MSFFARLTSSLKPSSAITERQAREVYGDTHQGSTRGYHSQVQTFAGSPEVYAHVVR